MKKLSVPALAIAAFAVACADPAGPNAGIVSSLRPSATVTDQIGGFPSGMVAGEVRLCKTVPAGDPTGDVFNFTVTVESVWPLPAGSPSSSQVQVTAGGACADVFLSSKNGQGLDKVTIVENTPLPSSNWALQAINTLRIDGGPGYTPPTIQANPLITGDNVTEDVPNRTSVVYINNDMGRVVTFVNDFTPTQTTGCTYTKGWYQNKNGAPTVIAVDGRSISEAQQIFAATPGKPGNVTFGGNNALLNLYQQLLAALNNLGGDANEDNGPDAVDQAIDAAQNGTGGTGLNITTTLTSSQIGALSATLAAFNEGTFTGWPHCQD